ncbi:MAG TPA: EAL domain-containing protein [Methylophilaceae bacterium]|nr:EAL domain-containing protein [Methylophilaceae bacterium]
MKEKLSAIERAVARIVLVYLGFGLLWIFFSDSALALLTTNQEQYQRYSMYKGAVFFLLTAILLYVQVRGTLMRRFKSEQSLMLSEERWKFALEGAGEGVWDWNLHTDEVFRSSRWHEIYGYSENDIGNTATEGRKLMHPDDLQQAIEDTRAYLEGRTKTYVSEFRLRCKDGSWKWTLSRGKVVETDPAGRPLRMIGIHTDISDRKHSEAQVFQLAHYDSLTGLPNRVLFLDRLHQDLRKAQRNGHSVTLIFLDLDRFKEVNDALGHDAGDQLLKETAQRLKSCVRASDTVARLGGDEFTIILSDLSDSASLEKVAQNILDRLAEPFRIGEELIYLSTSIGITIFPDDATDLEVLLKNADQAMYAAKDAGRNRYNYFTASMQQAAQMRMRLANDLRAAISAREFLVLYQPIVALATGEVCKAEALIRWQHPVRGLVSPVEFIPVAEDTGLISEIGDFVFRQAAEQALRWRRHRPDFQISVNKSPVQFRANRNIHATWLNHLASMALPGESLVIEITEGLLLDASEPVIRQLQEFHKQGLQIAIDDFGTGYSSLAYLKKFDIDYVKIDRSFTGNIQQSSDDMALCEAIIVMAHKLGLQVVAEGVETVEQRDLLLAAGCDFAQGYLFSKPVKPEEMEKLL